MKKIVARIAKDSPKPTKRFLKITEKDLLRFSISFFITGSVFLIIKICFLPNNESTFFEIVTAFFMGLALFCFPYISKQNKNKLVDSLPKFCGYMILIVFTAFFLFSFIINSMQGKVDVLVGVISAILLFFSLNFTIKPIIAIVSFVSTKIKQSSAEKGESKIQTAFKNTFANIAIVTSFIISMLTIIVSTIEILSKLGVV